MPVERSKYNFVNIVELSSLYPEYFNSLPFDKIEKLKVRDRVKICNGDQRFWVEITQITQTVLKGKVLNRIRSDNFYNLDDTVIFLRENIYDAFFIKDLKIQTAMNFLKERIKSEVPDSEIQEIINEISDLIKSN